jgi:hypothetical protein
MPLHAAAGCLGGRDKPDKPGALRISTKAPAPSIKSLGVDILFFAECGRTRRPFHRAHASTLIDLLYSCCHLLHLTGGTIIYTAIRREDGFLRRLPMNS